MTGILDWLFPNPSSVVVYKKKNLIIFKIEKCYILHFYRTVIPSTVSSSHFSFSRNNAGKS
jgi:hypothetical protein